MKQDQRGFIPILIAIIVVAALAIGGGVYISHVSKNRAAMKANADLNASTTADITANASSTAGVTASASETLRALLASGKDTVCTFTTPDPRGVGSGTAYISGTSIKVDFTVQGGTTNGVNHLLKVGDKVYVWTDSSKEGGLISFASLGIGSTTSATSSPRTVDLDRSIRYQCSPWTVDSAKFIVPTTVTFHDVAAMFQGIMPGNAAAGGSVRVMPPIGRPLPPGMKVNVQTGAKTY